MIRFYKLICNETGMCYIGKTKCTLQRRLWEHKSNYKRYNEGFRKYKITSYDIIDKGNYSIELLEEVETDDKEIIKNLEGNFVRNTENCLNKRIENRTKIEWGQQPHIKQQRKEYREKNKEKLKKKKKEYYETNKNQLLEKQKIYREKHQDKYKEYLNEYYQKNKELFAEKGKEYREKNKEYIKNRQNKKYNCPCGGKYTYSHKASHMKTSRHKKYEGEFNSH